MTMVVQDTVQFRMLLLQVVSMLLGTVTATTVGVGHGEVVVPERYLRPRQYNPHPLQTLLSAAAPADYSPLLDQHPYQLFQRPQHPDSSPVQFPDVPPTAKPTKSRTPGYITVPKNYAFSYAVKDRQSGDDFSHEQAHNGQSTKGEYRVKLPDGRTQIVSYTADSHGYKADVRYDGEAKQADRVYYTPAPPSYGGLSNSILPEPEPDYQEEPEVIYKQPVQIVYKQNRVAQQYTKVEPTPRPLEVLFSPTPQPYKSLSDPYRNTYNGLSDRYKTAVDPYKGLTPLQYRTLPQTAEQYTSQDTGSYYPHLGVVLPPTPAPGYYAPAVSSTAATPIEEEQDDAPPPRKPSPTPRYYASTPAPSPSAEPPVSRIAQEVRYILVPHPDYSDNYS